MEGRAFYRMPGNQLNVADSRPPKDLKHWQPMPDAGPWDASIVGPWAKGTVKHPIIY